MGRPLSGKVWRSYEEASAWAQSQQITSVEVWRKEVKIPGFLPVDIPADPNACYGDKFKKGGGYGGFLGTRRVDTRLRHYRPLKEASRWAIEQGVKGFDDWVCKVKMPGFLPSDIPASLSKVYGKAFKEMGGWGGFLGTGRISNADKGKQFWPLEKVAKWAQEKGVISQIDWQQRCKDPSFRSFGIPASPPRAYGKEAFNAFGGWGGFLGTDRKSSVQIKRQAVSLDKASAWAKENGIVSSVDWFDRIKKDQNFREACIPRNPASFYGEAFRALGGWPGFLGHAKVPGQSKVERIFRLLFSEIFDCPVNFRQRVIVDGYKPFSVDMMCPTTRLVVEYDGSYFHAGEKAIARDKWKTTCLVKAGWKVVRIRERPLALLRKKWDVQVSHKDDYGTRIKEVFEHLVELIDYGKIVGGKKLSAKIKKKLASIHLADGSVLVKR